MTRFRHKPTVIEAMQWMKLGDHPEVQRFGTPRNDIPCERCQAVRQQHGWIETPIDGAIVCPGDWIITNENGEMYPLKPEIFEANYQKIIEGKSDNETMRIRHRNYRH